MDQRTDWPRLRVFPDEEQAHVLPGRDHNMSQGTGILNKDNLNRAYKRVKANKGGPGVDGMTIEEALLSV